MDNMKSEEMKAKEMKAKEMQKKAKTMGKLECNDLSLKRKTAVNVTAVFVSK